MADSVSKITAICTRCGAPATKTQRLAHTKGLQTVMVGESESYEARCGNHHEYADEFFLSPERPEKTNRPEVNESSMSKSI